MKAQINIYTVYRDTEKGLETMGTFSGISQQDAIDTMARRENLSREQIYSQYVAIPVDFMVRYKVKREQ